MNADKSGFTLIELLVVIAIIGMLSSVVLGSLNSARSKSRYARAISDMKEMSKAATLDYDQYENYAPDLGSGSGPRFVPGFLKSWPTPPCSGWTYDWENWSGGGVIRVSMRKVDMSPVYYFCIYTDATCGINGGTAIENAPGKTLTCNE
ncbi:MAG: protein ral secretion pathway protein [Candidatus Parcubacteria bacterium]|jgi:prepilin-type N-terminal cleavage/methylation domain-containing protein